LSTGNGLGLATEVEGPARAVISVGLL